MRSGVDPAARIDDDLQQLKTLLETGETTAHGQTVTREELRPEFGVQGV